jgi:diguanylate cyclase (GGDEF)-like protein
MPNRSLILDEPNSFDDVLLWAPDMPTLASAAARHFERLGASNANLIWSIAELDLELAQYKSCSALTEQQAQLFEQVQLHGDYTEKNLGGLNHATTLLTAKDNLHAWLYIEYPVAKSDPRQKREWQIVQNKLALRCSSLLQKERLRLNVDRLANAERLQRALFAISDLSNSDKETHDVLHEIHQIVSSLMYAKNFFIVRYNKNDESMRFIYFADSKDLINPDVNEITYARDIPNSLTMAMLRLGKPVHGPSYEIVDVLNVIRDDSLGPDSVDWLGVPMMDHAEVAGGIVVQSYDEAYSYSDEDQAILAYVAQHILTALQRRDAQEDLEKRVSERTLELQQEIEVRQRSERLQQALFRIAEVSQNSESTDLFYASVHGIIAELLHAKNFYIAFLIDDGKHLEFPYYVDERDNAHANRPLGRGLTEYIIRTAQASCFKRSDIDILESQGEITVIGEKSVSWLGVPLFIAGKVIGVIALQSYSDDYFYKESDKELVSFVAIHIANALERRLANENLRNAYIELEQRVIERTHELAHTNIELREQIIVRERIEHTLKHETLHDALTGLPNRTQLLERLRRALGQFHQDPRKLFAVLFLDLDRFKIVNDSVGHLVGDQLLIQVAKCIGNCIRKPDLIARLGGDEFAIVLENIKDQEYVAQVADRIIRSFHAPMRIAGKELFTSASIGIAIVEARYSKPEDLLRDADVAMYRAKASGRNRYDIFDEGLHETAFKALELENDLRRALSRNEFIPHYQPIAQLHDGKIIGFEALIRWMHPVRGILQPSEFLNVAAETGNLEAMDWQIYEQVCHDLRVLSAHGTYVSLNVSPMHLRDKTFAERFLAMLDRHQVKPTQIRLEITEGALLEDPEQVHACLLTLKRLGIHTLLDDFGTGYSSLSYLHRFPLSGIKIDRSFVSALLEGQQGGSAAIIRAICLMADSLSLQVIAEGIETNKQCQQLRLLGLTLGQGYFFAVPANLRDVSSRH